MIDELVALRKQFNYYKESKEQLKKHFEAQINDKQIRWIIKDGKVVAYADALWISSIDDVYYYEQTGKERGGDILYINNVVVDKKYKGTLFDLWKMRPEHKKIAWKTKDNKFKIWQKKDGYYEKIFETAF